MVGRPLRLSMNPEKPESVAKRTAEALQRLRDDEQLLREVCHKAVKKFRSCIVVEARLFNIYDGLVQRPSITQKVRDRMLERAVTSLRRLQENCDHLSIGKILDNLLSPVALSVFNVNLSKLSRRNKEFLPLLSLRRVTNESRRKLQREIFSEDSSTSSVLKNKWSKDEIRRLKIVLKHLKKLDEFVGSQSEIRSFLEIAFNKLVAPAYSPSGKNGFHTFREMIVNLMAEIQPLKQRRLFYALRNISTEAAKKRYLIEKYSDLIREIYGSKRNRITAAVLSVAEPEYFPELTYADVADTLKRRKK